MSSERDYDSDSNQPSDAELVAREDSQLLQEAVEYVMQGLSIQDAEIEESHRRLFGEMTPATLQAIQNKYEELYIEDLLEAAVRAGLLTRTVAEDGREQYRGASDTLWEGDTALENAHLEYMRWQTT